MHDIELYSHNYVAMFYVPIRPDLSYSVDNLCVLVWIICVY